jgi:hypothetical protein
MKNNSWYRYGNTNSKGLKGLKSFTCTRRLCLDISRKLVSFYFKSGCTLVYSVHSNESTIYICVGYRKKYEQQTFYDCSLLITAVLPQDFTGEYK